MFRKLLLITCLSINCAYAQYVDTDPTWDYIISNNLIPINVNSTAGIKGTEVEIDNTTIEVGLYGGREFKKDIKIHTLGNDNISRSNFLKWTRWYQENGNTQIFRLFEGEHNVRNERRPSPRIEAETRNYTDGTKGEWTTWSGRYTFPKSGSFNIFQIWGRGEFKQSDGSTKIKDTGLMMLRLLGSRFVWDRREIGVGSQLFTLAENVIGKSYDVMIRDNGLDYEIYLNGELVVEYTRKRLSGCHFRWGAYGESFVRKDFEMYISGAKVDVVDMDSGPNGYTFAANEKEVVSIDGTFDIAYGANGKYVYLYNQTSDIVCNNSTFGGDPIIGVKKKCYKKSSDVLGVSTDDLDSNIKNQLLVYPNPTKQDFTIQSLGQDISEITIYNARGQLVYNSKGQTNKLIIHKPFAVGFYLIKVRYTDTSIGIKKLVVNP